MIQLLVFTGMMAIIQIEAVMVQAVAVVQTAIQDVNTFKRIFYSQPDPRLILVKPAVNTDMRSASLWGSDC